MWQNPCPLSSLQLSVAAGMLEVNLNKNKVRVMVYTELEKFHFLSDRAKYRSLWIPGSNYYWIHR